VVLGLTILRRCLLRRFEGGGVGIMFWSEIPCFVVGGFAWSLFVDTLVYFSSDWKGLDWMCIVFRFYCRYGKYYVLVSCSIFV
jgi:hypothetical protein